MHASHGTLVAAATDLSDFLACHQLARLKKARALGLATKPFFDDPGREVLQRRGEEHERAILARYEAGGRRVARIPRPDFGGDGGPDWEGPAAATLAAMEDGADVIYQGVLLHGGWLGLPDFLERVERDGPGAPAVRWEVVDAKLAREPKAEAVLQIALYSDLVARQAGRDPERMHLELAGAEARRASFRFHDFAAFMRSVRRRFEAEIVGVEAPPLRAPEPRDRCRVCDWKPRCRGEWEEADHLCLVAGIARRQRARLTERGVETVRSLATLPLPVEPPLEGVGDAAIERVREQARIQVEGREAGQPRYELLEPEEGRGLAALPSPSPGDLFFDIEGDPFALHDGLEYLFGWTDAEGSYACVWALDRAGEKAAFERFVDLVTELHDRHPGMHVYHFGHYEPTALKRLAGRHATREVELDRLLRGEVFVDLHRVVKRGLRASVESYSIKKLEPLYGFERDEDLRDASSALAHFEAWLELGRREEEDAELLGKVEAYNRDDCLSTLRLRGWLEERREELARELAREIPRPELPSPDPSESVADEDEETARRVRALGGDRPHDPDEPDPELRARWLLAQLLGYYRREDRSAWWEYFRLMDLDEDELIDDRSALGGLEYDGVTGEVRRSYVHRYRFPPQDHRIRAGQKVVDADTGDPLGEVHAISDEDGWLELTRGKGSEPLMPRSLFAHDHVGTKDQRESLRSLADDVLAHGFPEEGPLAARADLLLARPPRAGQTAGAPLRRSGEETLACARRLSAALRSTVLPVQGPPGSGKTYTGARMVVDLLAAGKRVGVTATSHKVISNLLADICDDARERGLAVRGIQKAKADQHCGRDQIERTEDPPVPGEKLREREVSLAAGTAWLWSRPDMAGSVDALFIDEAGQFSLADALAVARAADSVVLLGDPGQLQQPTQGVHPPGADASALEHLLAGERTVPDDRGLFLDRTWRLHPDLCAFTSELFYQGRLESRPELARQRLHGPDELDGTGLRLVTVPHEGNQSESPEEVARVKELFDRLLDRGCGWTRRDGVRQDLGIGDVLVVAPYNAQVAALRAALPSGARVGTVDKFQGQEAPLVIYSVTTSSSEDAPRGMDFLYSAHRLNVATSRAMCMAIVVASPAVFDPECRTVEQMRLANAFCRLREVGG